MIGECVNADRKKGQSQWKLALLTKQSGQAVKSTTFQECGDTWVADTWINGYFSLGSKDGDKHGIIPKTMHSWWKKKRCSAPCTTKIEVDVSHINTEHYPEADHVANWRAEIVSKVIVETLQNTETWESDANVLGRQ